MCNRVEKVGTFFIQKHVCQSSVPRSLSTVRRRNFGSWEGHEGVVAVKNDRKNSEEVGRHDSDQTEDARCG